MASGCPVINSVRLHCRVSWAGQHCESGLTVKLRVPGLVRQSGTQNDERLRLRVKFSSVAVTLAQQHLDHEIVNKWQMNTYRRVTRTVIAASAIK